MVVCTNVQEYWNFNVNYAHLLAELFSCRLFLRQNSIAVWKIAICVYIYKRYIFSEIISSMIVNTRQFTRQLYRQRLINVSERINLSSNLSITGHLKYVLKSEQVLAKWQKVEATYKFSFTLSYSLIEVIVFSLKTNAEHLNMQYTLIWPNFVV